MQTDIMTAYLRRCEHCGSAVTRLTAAINRYAVFRLLTIVLGFAGIYQVLELRSVPLTLIAFFLVMIVFAYLVRKHSRLYAEREYYQDLRRVCDNETGSLLHGSNIYGDGSRRTDDRHAYASDLDLFGPGSLFQLLNRCSTLPGEDRLAGWLLGAADRDTIRQRQLAVRELTAKQDWILDVQARLLPHHGKNDELPGLFAYLNMAPLFSGRKALRTYVAAAPFVFLAFLALTVYENSFGYLLVLTGLLNGALIYLNMSGINRTDRLIGRAGKVLKSFGEIFRRIENETWQSALCVHLQSGIGRETGETLSQRIRQLSALTDKLDYRLNIFVSIILNYIFVWDLKQVFALEAWKEENKHNLETAFDVVAEFEALISLTSLHTNHPGWTFPVVTEPGRYTILAEKMGHPLIRKEVRVTNRFELEDAAIIEIITGSNMAGKSTFLRTVGINAVLAFAGAPACAERLEISLMKLVTYMRIRDSLNESTSTFKAELDRLKMILDTAGGTEKTYFLIDEMLRGTNSVDKYRGSRAVIKKLLNAGAAGMVATHDLQLAGLQAEHPGRIRNYHFDIRVEQGEMRFDYLLKEGECVTFNASLLLRKIGVDV